MSAARSARQTTPYARESKGRAFGSCQGCASVRHAELVCWRFARDPRASRPWRVLHAFPILVSG
jgi:hypothetical protein